MKSGNFASSIFRRRSAREVPKTTLERSLGSVDLVVLGVGNCVTGGVVVLGGVAVKVAGPAVTLSFVFAGLAALCVSLCYSEFASRMPSAGSAYVFTYMEAGEIVAWNVGWGLTVERLFGIPRIALSWSHYTLRFLAALGVHRAWLGEYTLNSFITIDWLALAFIIVLSMVVAAGTSQSKIANHLATGISLSALLLVVVLGFYKADGHHWDDFMPNGHWSVLRGAGIVMVAFSHFDIVCNAAEECNRPKEALPIGMIGTVLISICVYVSVAAALTLMVHWTEVDVEAPLAMAFAGWLPWMVPVVSLAFLIGVLAVGIGSIFGTSRVLMALSRDGLLPPFLGAVHETRRTPVTATAIVAFTSCLITVLLSFEQLVQLASAGTMIALSAVCADLILARKLPRVGGAGSSPWLLPALLLGYVVSLFLGAVSVLASGASELGYAIAAGAFGALGCGVAILALPEVYRPEESFVAPCGPLVALIGIAMNMMMLSSLEIEVLYFMGVWFVVGNIIYATYGFWNSTLAREAGPDRDTEESPILA